MRLFGSTTRKLKKARVSQGGSRGLQQLGHMAPPKSAEVRTKVPKRPRSEDSTPTDKVNIPKGPRTLLDQRTIGRLTNVRIAMLGKDSHE